MRQAVSIVACLQLDGQLWRRQQTTIKEPVSDVTDSVSTFVEPDVVMARFTVHAITVAADVVPSATLTCQTGLVAKLGSLAMHGTR